ncbi:GNAT family N-acetyltransferase, partial [Serratia marcescens]
MSIIHRLAQPDDLNGLLDLYRELRPQDAPLRADDA